MPWTVERPFETLRAVAAHLRRSPHDHDQEAAEWIAQTLDQTPAGCYDVTMTVSDEDYFRSVYPSGLALGLPMPVDR